MRPNHLDGSPPGSVGRARRSQVRPITVRTTTPPPCFTAARWSDCRSRGAPNIGELIAGGRKWSADPGNYRNEPASSRTSAGGPKASRITSTAV